MRSYCRKMKYFTAKRGKEETPDLNAKKNSEAFKMQQKTWEIIAPLPWMEYIMNPHYVPQLTSILQR